MLSTRDHLQIQGHIYMQSERTGKNVHANGNHKKAGVAILLEETDFKRKTVTQDTEGCHTMIQGSIQEEDVTFVNVYGPT